RFIFTFFCLSFLVSCSSTQLVAPAVDATSTIQSFIKPSSSSRPPTRTATIPPKATQTATLILCNPLTADFCITDGHFLLQRPIHPPANDSADRTYPFASTAGGAHDP